MRLPFVPSRLGLDGVKATMIFPLPSDVAPAIFLLSAPMGLALALVLRLRYLRAYGTGRGIRFR